MQNKKTLLIFPLVTQLIFSLIAAVIDGFSWGMISAVFFVVALPAFLVAIPCVKFNYHQRQLFPIGFWCGTIGFVYMLAAMLWLSGEAEQYSLWDSTLMSLLSALAYALTAVIYGLVALRPFLRKRSTD